MKENKQKKHGICHVKLSFLSLWDSRNRIDTLVIVNS